MWKCTTCLWKYTTCGRLIFLDPALRMKPLELQWAWKRPWEIYTAQELMSWDAMHNEESQHGGRWRPRTWWRDYREAPVFLFAKIHVEMIYV